MDRNSILTKYKEGEESKSELRLLIGDGKCRYQLVFYNLSVRWAHYPLISSRGAMIEENAQLEALRKGLFDKF